MMSNSNVQDVPVTGEARVSVVNVRLFEHVFAVTIKKKGVWKYSFEEFLKSWLIRKGEIHLKSMEMKVTFTKSGGNLAIGFTQKDSAISDYSELLTIPNRFVFGSNAYNTNMEHVSEFKVPAGFTDKIWPLTGALPLGAVVFATKNEVEVDVTLVMTVDATGPYVHRYLLDLEQNSVIACTEGFQ